MIAFATFEAAILESRWTARHPHQHHSCAASRTARAFDRGQRRRWIAARHRRHPAFRSGVLANFTGTYRDVCFGVCPAPDLPPGRRRERLASPGAAVLGTNEGRFALSAEPTARAQREDE